MEETKILTEIEKLKQKPQLNRRERRYLAKLELRLHPEPKLNAFNWKTLSTKIIVLILVAVSIGGVVWYIQSQPNLPPIDMAGHIEQNPKSHVLDEPMPESIQKHMLEHADGEGAPGVIIQYNCTKPYVCEAGLVDKLKKIVKKYPKNLYLAPGDYTGKIILTRLGKREILDSYFEKKITDFIIN